MMFFLGLCCGFVLAMIGQWELEKQYSLEGIAKIYGRYYKIKPLNDNGGEDNGKE